MTCVLIPGKHLRIRRLITLHRTQHVTQCRNLCSRRLYCTPIQPLTGRYTRGPLRPVLGRQHRIHPVLKLLDPPSEFLFTLALDGL